ncbi:MAG: hypothetical protein J6Q22_09760 [Prevotella sp.]|nr:hypothetical protein [Prevotella sp.]
MAEEVKSVLVKSLEEANRGGASVKEYLSSCLLSELGKATMDEGFFKRKRGRPKKDPTTLGDLPEEKYARAAMLEDKKKRARLQDRLNPGSTEEERKKIRLNADLREIGWDLEECPGSDSDFKEMEDELRVLWKEAGETDGLAEERDNFDKVCKEFNALKKEAAIYYDRAKECLGKDDFRRVEELVEYLKTKPRELAGIYERVEKEYDGLCETLCSLADSGKREMGAASPDSLEVEKQGFGMMWGENYDRYAKRMKEIGRGREIPKSIRDEDRIVEGTERRWRSVAGVSLSDFSVIRDNWKKTIRGLMQKSFISSNLKIGGVNRLLSEGLDFGDYDVGYGLLQPMSPFGSSIEIGGQYGEIVVRWKPHRIVATMSFVDSISIGREGYDFVCQSFVTCPSPCSFDPECKALIDRLKNGAIDASIDKICGLTDMPYCEVQLHGDSEDYDAEAVDGIYFSSEYEVCNLTVEALMAIEENDISLYVKDSQIEIKDGKVVRIEEEGEG